MNKLILLILTASVLNQIDIINGGTLSEKFEKMCSSVKNSGGRQFAVLWIGENENNPDVQFDVNEDGGLFKSDGNNYIAARVLTNHDIGKGAKKTQMLDRHKTHYVKLKNDQIVTKHTEVVILDHLENMLKSHTNENKGSTTNLYLFSFYNPCTFANDESCSAQLGKRFNELKKEFPNIKLTVGWDKLYIDPKTKLKFNSQFLVFLKRMFAPEAGSSIAIEYKDGGFCYPRDNGWYQMELYHCIEKKSTNNFECSSKEAFLADLKKMINRIIYKCADDIKALDTCWKDEIKSLIKRDEHQKTTEECFQNMAGINEENQIEGSDLRYQLGPPLNPDSHDDPSKPAFGNSVDILEGQKNEILCFSLAPIKTTKNVEYRDASCLRIIRAINKHSILNGFLRLTMPAAITGSHEKYLVGCPDNKLFVPRLSNRILCRALCEAVNSVHKEVLA